MCTCSEYAPHIEVRGVSNFPDDTRTCRQMFINLLSFGGDVYDVSLDVKSLLGKAINNSWRTAVNNSTACAREIPPPSVSCGRKEKLILETHRRRDDYNFVDHLDVEIAPELPLGWPQPRPEVLADSVEFSDSVKIKRIYE